MDGKSYELRLISAARNFIFGFSILYLVWFHSITGYANNFINTLYRMGESGVDIFLVLSGMGLYYSYSKDNDLKHFYAKRLLRILPSCLLVCVPFFLYKLTQHGDIFKFIRQIFLVEFFVSGELTEWFITALLCFYLIYPAVHMLFKKLRYSPLALAGICMAIYAVYIAADSSLGRIGLLWLRLPAFLTGAVLGHYIKAGACIKNKRLVLLAAFLLMLAAMLLNMLFFDKIKVIKYMTELLYALCLIILLAVLDTKAPKAIKAVFLFYSAITLEIYLVHEKLWDILLTNWYDILFWDKFWIVNIIAFIMATLLALVVRRLADMLTAAIRRGDKALGRGSDGV